MNYICLKWKLGRPRLNWLAESYQRPWRELLENYSRRQRKVAAGQNWLIKCSNLFNFGLMINSSQLRGNVCGNKTPITEFKSQPYKVTIRNFQYY